MIRLARLQPAAGGKPTSAISSCTSSNSCISPSFRVILKLNSQFSVANQVVSSSNPTMVDFAALIVAPAGEFVSELITSVVNCLLV